MTISHGTVYFALLFIQAVSNNHLKIKNLRSYDIIENPAQLRTKPPTISLKALNRHFVIDLFPQPLHMYQTEFNLIDGPYIFKKPNINLPEVTKGRLHGDPSAKASIFIGSKGEFYATISTEDEVFFFEPLSYFENWSDKQQVLVYRLSDVILPNVSFPTFQLSMPSKQTHEPLSRHKRELPADKKFCGLHFIADYSFFFHVGGQDYAKTVDIIVKAFNRVNEIFMSTEFIDEDNNSTGSGYGLYIKGISIETSPTALKSEINSAKALLSAFSRRNFSNACLHHFLTFSKNPFGVLGMSWMAGPSIHHLGGICSAVNYMETGNEEAVILAPNTGFTTYCDSEGTQVLSSVAELVTAHELGHSWGAPHDPDTPECSPPAEAGGRFLMYTFAVPGYSPNNYRFSPCSRRAIGRCLASRAALCFEDRPFADGLQRSHCGNSRIDPGEECDPGSRRSEDPCCTADCRLKPTAKCSPLNHQCCTPSCQLAAKGTLCAKPDPAVSPCLSAGHCDGQSPVCPGPLPVSEIGKRCHEHGYCSGGVCMPFCSRLGLRTCICDRAEESCLICCSFDLKLANGERRPMCQPIAAFASLSLANQSSSVQNGSWRVFELPVAPRNLSEKCYFVSGADIDVPPGYDVEPGMLNISQLVTMHLENNRPCTIGFCRSGVCVESDSQRVGRLWPLFLSTSGWTTFIWDNIVGVIVTLTLIVWVPLSLIVWFHDKKLREAQLRAAENQLQTPAVQAHVASAPATETPAPDTQ